MSISSRTIDPRIIAAGWALATSHAAIAACRAFLENGSGLAERMASSVLAIIVSWGPAGNSVGRARTNTIAGNRSGIRINYSQIDARFGTRLRFTIYPNTM